RRRSDHRAREGQGRGAGPPRRPRRARRPVCPAGAGVTRQLASAASQPVGGGGPDPELSPLLLRRGEATLFVAAVVSDGGAGRRRPVVTVQAPALLSVAPAPAGWRWMLGPG